MHKLLVFIVLVVLSSGGVASAGTVYVDTLDDITGRDGTAVSERNIGGVIVTILPAAGGDLVVATYNMPHNDYGFLGVGTKGIGPWNVPANPAAVSGSRFLTGDGDSIFTFMAATPLAFLFSEPVQSFGLTTLDVLESGHPSSYVVTFEAFDATGSSLDLQSRSGAKGPSGLDLDWMVSSPFTNISRVVLNGNFDTGYGIDDLVVEVPARISLFSNDVISTPLPSAVWLGLGMLGALGVARRFRRKIARS